MRSFSDEVLAASVWISFCCLASKEASLFFQDFGDAGNRREWRAYFVAHMGEEIALGPGIIGTDQADAQRERGPRQLFILLIKALAAQLPQQLLFQNISRLPFLIQVSDHILERTNTSL